MNSTFSSKFLKSVMSTGTASLISIVSGFINIMVAVRYITKEHFGVYILIQVIISSVSTISDLGLNISTTKQITGCEEPEKYELLSTMLCFKLASSILVGLALFSAQSLLAPLFKSEIFLKIAVYMPLLFVLESFSGLLNASLQGFHLYRKMAVSQIIFSSLNLILILFFLTVFQFGIMGLIYARLLAQAICIAYQLTPFYSFITIKFRRDLFLQVLHFGFPLGLNNILTFLFMKVDTILIGALLAPIQIASYGTASKIPDACRQLFESFRTVFFPNMSELFAKGKGAEAKALLDNSLRLISAVVLFGTLVVFLFREELVTTIFSSAYRDSAPVLATLMVALSIGLIGNILGTSLVAAGHSKLPVIINIVDTTVNIAANIIMIPLFGVMGAAYAALLSRLATNPVNVWFLRRNGIRVRVWLYVRPAVIFAACVLPSLAFGAGGIFYNVLMAVLYPTACFAMGIVTRNDLANLLASIRFPRKQANIGT